MANKTFLSQALVGFDQRNGSQNIGVQLSIEHEKVILRAIKKLISTTNSLIRFMNRREKY